MSVSKEEFFKRLEEDIFFTEPQELINYRLPVVQFYLSNYANKAIPIPVNLSKVTIIYQDDDFTLVNRAFESIKTNINTLKQID